MLKAFRDYREKRVLSSISSFVAASRVMTCEKKHPVLAIAAHSIRPSVISLQDELDTLQTTLWNNSYTRLKSDVLST